MSNSSLKYLKQFFSSFEVGLSFGGTHFNAKVMYVLFSFNKSSLLIEFDLFEIFDLYKHLKRNSDDLSPVKTLPVLFAP